jgi:predicted nuclease with TOPRIM domain
MTNEHYQRLDEFERLNTLLTLELQVAETEIGSLKSMIERLENEHLALTEKLGDAKNEIARLDMMRKRNWDDLETVRRLGKPYSC